MIWLYMYLFFGVVLNFWATNSTIGWRMPKTFKGFVVRVLTWPVGLYLVLRKMEKLND